MQAKLQTWTSNFAINFAETGKQLELQATGTVAKPCPHFSQTTVRFPPTPVNGHNYQEVTITNPCTALAMPFTITEVAHFSASPIQGTIPANSSVNVTIGFVPRQLGKFHVPIMFHLPDLTSFKLIGIGQAEGTANRAFAKGITQVPVALSKHTAPVPQEAAALPQSIKASDHSESGPVNKHFEQKLQNGRKYSAWLQSQGKRRHEKAVAKVRVGPLDPVDLGMTPGEGLDEPQLRMPRIDVDSMVFSLKDQSTKHPTHDAARTLRNQLVEEGATHLVRRNLKPHPVGEKEERECRLVLPAGQLKHLVIGPKMLDFGQVSLYSKNNKTLFLVNNLSTHIHAKIPTDLFEELSACDPFSQVVPPGTTAAFHIQFMSDNVQTFQQPFHVLINGHHKLKFLVVADVNPLEVLLGQNEMHFEFDKKSLDFSIQQELTLHNHGNSDAQYEWLLEPTNTKWKTAVPEPEAEKARSRKRSISQSGPHQSVRSLGESRRIESKEDASSNGEAKTDGQEQDDGWRAFTISPADGCVPANGSVTATITYEPGRNVSLKNLGDAPTVFRNKVTMDSLTVTPTSGMLAPGESVEVHLTVCCTTPTVYAASIICEIRGGKTTKCLVKGEAVVPKVSLCLEQKLWFGTLFVGTPSHREVQLNNHGDVKAVFEVDLSMRPAWDILDTNHHPADFIAPMPEAENAAGGSIQRLMPQNANQNNIMIVDCNDSDSEAGSVAMVHNIEYLEDTVTTLRSEGKIWRITVLPMRSFAFVLSFCPATVGQVRFGLTLSVMGVPPARDTQLIREVFANVLYPQVSVDTLQVNFGSRIIVGEHTNKLPSNRTFALKNEADKDLIWELKCRGPHAHSGVFHVEPIKGELGPLQSQQIQIAFTPTAVDFYAMRVPLFFDGAGENLLEVKVYGSGSLPTLRFDRPEIVMPFVPLGVSSVATVSIRCEGYEDMQVRCNVPSQFPLQVLFPEGDVLSTTKPSVTAQITFSSPKPIAFSVKLDFLDEEGNKFPVAVSGAASNSSLLTFPYLSAKHHSGYSIIALDDDKPPSLEDDPTVAFSYDDDKVNRCKGTPDASRDVSPNASASSSPHASAANLDAKMHDQVLSDLSSASQGPRAHGHGSFFGDSNQSDKARENKETGNRGRLIRKFLSRRPMMRLGKFVSGHVLEDAGGSEDLTRLADNNFRPLLSLLELLNGKPMKLSGFKAGPGSKSSAALQMQHRIDDVVHHLRTVGAFLPDLNTAHLLPYSMMEQVAELSAQNTTVAGAGPGARALSTLVGGPTQNEQDVHERKFNRDSTLAWMQLVMEIMRVFFLARICWKNLLRVPQSNATSAWVTHWQTLGKKDPACAPSNVYSEAECLLLKWLHVHMEAHTPAVLESTGRPRSFLRDFQTGVPVGALWIGYIPGIAKNLDGMKFVMNEDADEVHNWEVLLQVMQEVGMQFHISAKEIVDNAGWEVVLLLSYLWFKLPQYLPSKTVTFEQSLLEKGSKELDIANQMKQPVTYRVILQEGAPDFGIADTQLTISAKGSSKLLMSFSPRFCKPVHGQVILIPNTHGIFSHPVLVFNLEAIVRESSHICKFDINTPLYEPLELSFEVENPFPSNGHFSVALQQDIVKQPRSLDPSELVERSYSTMSDGTSKPMGATLLRHSASPEQADMRPFVPLQFAKGISEAVSYSTYPEPFWISTDALQIKKGDRATLSLQFLPFVRGRYSCRVVLSDPRIGEFVYQFNAIATQPVVTERIHCQGEVGKTCVSTLTLPMRNPQLERALLITQDRFKSFKGKTRLPVPKEDHHVKYQIESLSPFFTCASELVLIRDGDPEESMQSAKGSAPRSDNKNTATTSIHFQPNKPGVYPCYLILASSRDVRVVEVEGSAIANALTMELEFECAARQSILQEIPVQNHSDQDCMVTFTLSGNWFSGPKEMRLSAGHGSLYPLGFHPTAVGESRGTLLVRNVTTQERVQYNLHGKSTDPVAEGEYVVECDARGEQILEIPVPNLTDQLETTYLVQLNSPMFAGPTEHVPGADQHPYKLQVNPALVGEHLSSVKFELRSNPSVYCWYSVCIKAIRPPAEKELTVRALVRGYAMLEVPIVNPSSHPVVFTVVKQGNGISGAGEQPELLEVPPLTETTYEVEFTPLQCGAWDGEMSFFNLDVGEFWYKLHLVGVDPEPEQLADAHCDLGKTVSRRVTLHNILDQPVALEVEYTNDESFIVHPNPDTMVTFSCAELGQWIFKLRGFGRLPTAMEPVKVTAAANELASGSVVFRNPYPHQRRFLVQLQCPTDESSEAFKLLLRKQTVSLGPGQTHNIPFLFRPKHLAEHSGTILVHLLQEGKASDEVMWQYPIVGLVEAMPTGFQLQVAGQSRKEVVQLVALPLTEYTGDKDLDSFTHEVNIVEVPEDTVMTEMGFASRPNSASSYASRPSSAGKSKLYVPAHARAVQQSVNVISASSEQYRQYIKDYDMVDITKTNPHVQYLFFTLSFLPLRPFEARAELLVRRAAGGVWKYP
eukprot:gene4709-858_t